VLLPLPPVEPALLPEGFIAPDRKLLLAVGRLSVQKGFRVLLDSFAALSSRHPSWDLALLGEGPERFRLEQQVAALELHQRVLMPGRAGNVGDWYNRADLYVLSSDFEGFPNTLAEAMAHGCPAVSFDCDTGPRDVIRHEQNGLLVTPVGDVSALESSLDRLMGDDAERERMSANAIEVRERFSLQRILALWDRQFEKST
jgi:glycosyltransferase involved in cell wall biosynthesis